jgi:hypothetical protein
MVAKVFHCFLTSLDRVEKTYIWYETSQFPFNELIISWNGVRPTSGKIVISFSCQQDNCWTPFFPYAEWGIAEQKSCSFTAPELGLKLDQDTICLERGASAFRIKIEGSDGIRSLHASVRNASIQSNPSVDYRSERIKLSLPAISQMKIQHPRNNHICSPSSTTAVVRFLLNNQNIDPADFAENAYDKDADIYGNWSLNIAAAANLLGDEFYCYACRLNSFQEIIDNLREGIPSVVSVKGSIPNAPLTYTSGHLIAVTGINCINPDTKELYCMDPAFSEDSKTHVSYKIDDFLKAWHERGSLAYIFKKTSLRD